MTDLLPCPQCGSVDVTPELVRNVGRTSWTVACAVCRARVPEGPESHGFEEAVARWNERRAN